MSLKFKGRIKETIIDKIVTDHTEQTGILDREVDSVASLLVMLEKMGLRRTGLRRNWGFTSDVYAIDTNI